MAAIQVNPSEIINYGNQIIEKASDYKMQIGEIYNTVDELKKNWTGAASQRFVSEIESFESDYRKFGEIINEFGELLIEIGRAYDRLEQDL